MDRDGTDKDRSDKDRPGGDRTGRPDGTPAEEGAIKDEGWSKVDLHDRTRTSDADLPSDLEPDED